MNGRALLAVTLAVGAAGAAAAVGVTGAHRVDIATTAPGTDDGGRLLDWDDCPDLERPGGAGRHSYRDDRGEDDGNGEVEVEGTDATGARCADLEVPVDHADPAGGTLRLSLLRVPATGDAADRIGTLLVHPGGPGATARAFANEMAQVLPGPVVERFDVVGVDPRGTGASALDCGYDVAELFGADPVVGGDAEAAALVGVNRDYVAACRAEAGDLLPHLGTRDAARDLDAVRAALGDDRISYLGYGYGTVVGQTYAQLFPDRVRAMVLDGGVPLGRPGLRLAHDQAVGFEQALAAFAQDCDAELDCPASPDALGAVTELRLRARQDPVPAEPRDLGVGEVETGLALPLHDRSRWHDLATAVEAALLGNGTRLVALADQHLERVNVDLSYAVTCFDLAWPTGPAGPRELLAAGAATAAEAPHFGDPVTNRYLPCTMWPVAADPLAPPAGPPRTAVPVLVVSTTGDPAAPYAGGVELAQQLGAALLTHRGEGHTVVGRGVGCVDGAVARYLVDLDPPGPGATCGTQEALP